MKEAIGGVSLFQIVILFVLLFTGVMCLTINQSKAFGVKDEIINIIQNESIGSTSGLALNANTLTKISDHLKAAGYRLTGDCPSGWIGYNREGITTSNGKNSAFCIKTQDVPDTFTNYLQKICENGKCEVAEGGYPEMVYYEVMVFYQLDIPVLNEIMQFRIKGSTKVLVRS